MGSLVSPGGDNAPLSYRSTLALAGRNSLWQRLLCSKPQVTSGQREGLEPFCQHCLFSLFFGLIPESTRTPEGHLRTGFRDNLDATFRQERSGASSKRKCQAECKLAATVWEPMAPVHAISGRLLLNPVVDSDSFVHNARMRGCMCLKEFDA